MYEQLQPKNERNQTSNADHTVSLARHYSLESVRCVWKEDWRLCWLQISNIDTRQLCNSCNISFRVQTRFSLRMVLRACSACGVSKAKRQYSHNQWQKIEAASKCKTCVEQAQSAAAAAAAATGRGVTGWKGGKKKGLPNPGSNHSGDAGPAELTDAEVGWCAELDAALEEDGGGESGDVNRDTTELDSDDLERRTEEVNLRAVLCTQKKQFFAMQSATHSLL